MFPGFVLSLAHHCILDVGRTFFLMTNPYLQTLYATTYNSESLDFDFKTMASLDFVSSVSVQVSVLDMWE